MKRAKAESVTSEIKLSSPYAVGKRQRRSITIAQKISLLDKLNTGSKLSDLSRQYDINDSAIRSLIRNEKLIRHYAANCSIQALQSAVYVPHSPLLDQTEIRLYEWYKNHLAERPFTVAKMCKKARQIYSELRNSLREKNRNARNNEEQDELAAERDFKASKPWFHRFQKQYNIELTTEISRQSKQTCIRPCLLRLLNSYNPQQVFCATELSLPWRALPLPQTTAFKINSRIDRLSLLLCVNAHGDFAVKPLLVHRAQQPFSLRARPRDEWPVFWRGRDPNTQRNPCVTAQHLSDWLTECFGPTVENYLGILEMPKKCLLILDNNMSNTLNDINVNVNYDINIQFVSRSQQPLNGTIEQLFNAIYQCYLLERLEGQLKNIHDNITISPTEHFWRLWRNLNAGDSVDLIATSVESISADCWNSGWSNLWPNVVRHEFDVAILDNHLQRIVEVAHRLPGHYFSKVTLEMVQRELKTRHKSANDNTATPIIINEEQIINEDENEDEDDGEASFQINQESDPLASIEEQNNMEEFSFNVTNCGLKTVKLHSHSNFHNTTSTNQVKNINRALRLAKELASVVSNISQSDSLSKDNEAIENFANALDELMQPIRRQKERFLQPSIRDYFRCE